MKFPTSILLALIIAHCILMSAPLTDPEQQHILDHICAYRGDRTFLLSYPRSGNTWLRYCLEFLTQRPSFSRHGLYYAMQRPLAWSAGFAIDGRKTPIEKVHSRYETAIYTNGHIAHAPNPEKDLLILLVRNPKETFARHEHADWQSLLHDHAAGRGYLPDTYFDNLMLFESWPERNRILIYYEDLITSPRETLMHILTFLKEPTTRLDQFMHDYEYHRNACLTLYHHAISHGNDSLFYSKKTTVDFRRNVDVWIEKAYPTLWHAYLKDRYMTP